MAVTFNQLVDDGWSLGVTYRVSRAELDTRFKGIPATAAMFDGFQARQNLEAWLHQMRLFGGFNHPSGLFAQAESVWHQQSNQGYSPDIPGDDFWQFNLYGGWRFLNRRAEITLGILNLADQNYRLNPLNLTPDLPRDRTFLARFRVFF
jgi:outer membrane receptor protein involved in Fe transport